MPSLNFCWLTHFLGSSSGTSDWPSILNGPDLGTCRLCGRPVGRFGDTFGPLFSHEVCAPLPHDAAHPWPCHAPERRGLREKAPGDLYPELPYADLMLRVMFVELRGMSVFKSLLGVAQ